VDLSAGSRYAFEIVANSVNTTPIFVRSQFGEHNTDVLHTGCFRGLPGLLVLKSRPVSFSFVATEALSAADHFMLVTRRKRHVHRANATLHDRRAMEGA